MEMLWWVRRIVLSTNAITLLCARQRTMSSFVSRSLIRSDAFAAVTKTCLSSRISLRSAHTVRVIVCQDLPPKAYEGDILNVKAGYARNYLIPQKKVVYATRQNFEKLGLQDTELETTDQRRDRLAREAHSGEDLDLKAADLLKHYLRNKTVWLTQMYRFFVVTGIRPYSLNISFVFYYSSNCGAMQTLLPMH
jgi:hypothetical protein